MADNDDLLTGMLEEFPAEAEAEAPEPAEEPETDLVVTIDGVTPPPTDEEPEIDEAEEEAAPEWVKKTRVVNRELRKEIKELKAAQVAQPKPTQPVAESLVLGPKPTMDGAEFDADKFALSMETWVEQKRVVEARATEAKVRQDEAQAVWAKKNADFDKAGQRFKGFDEAKTVLSWPKRPVPRPA